MVSKISASKNLVDDVNKALEPLGGIRKFVKPGERVFIKPNFNTSDPPPASSDMAFIKAVISVIETRQPAKIILGESPTYFGNAKKNFEGKNPRALESVFPNVEVLFLNNKEWVQKTIPKGKYVKKVSLPKILDQVDKIIYLPCLKTHSWAQYTGALKLTVGLVKPIERLKMHASHLQEKIAEFNSIISPALIIMDARQCFITKGPSKGKIAHPNFILASDHRVKLDIEGIKIIQSFPGNDLKNIKPEDLPQISRAIAQNIP